MKLDGAEVLKNDRVWHDRYGLGTVVSVVGGTCDVRFDASPQLVTFAEGGVKNGVKVLWWQEPMLFVPEKGRDYSGLREVVAALLSFKYGGRHE